MITANVTEKRAYYVPVPADIWEAARVVLGDRFNGTVNQLDQWVRDCLPHRMEDYLASHLGAKRKPQQYVWTAYLG